MNTVERLCDGGTLDCRSTGLEMKFSPGGSGECYSEEHLRNEVIALIGPIFPSPVDVPVDRVHGIL